MVICAILLTGGIPACSKDDDEPTPIENDEPSSDIDKTADYTDDSSQIKINNNGHDYVDLGLKVLWATRNVGASNITSVMSQ